MTIRKNTPRCTMCGVKMPTKADGGFLKGVCKSTPCHELAFRFVKEELKEHKGEII